MKYQYRLVKITPTKMTKREMKSEGFDHHVHFAGKAVYTYEVDVLIERVEDQKELGVFSVSVFPFNRYGVVSLKSNMQTKKLFRKYFPRSDKVLSERTDEDILLADFLILLRRNLQSIFYQFNTIQSEGNQIHLQYSLDESMQLA